MSGAVVRLSASAIRVRTCLGAIRYPRRRMRKIFGISENNSILIRNCFLMQAAIRNKEIESIYLFESRKINA
ncbi:hypothetical protein [Paraburkholderia sediminicola]|jgi:hypothetical protein|uniref:hypothetical protein n=1 Tax=Paraburkholderia sediminicola TaxID=458836 RepID=UPI000FF67E8F